MESHIEKIISIGKITHDVLRIVLNKPAGYQFTPGQATEVSINKDGWKEEKRPFTFTCLPDDEHLEFTIKTYPERAGVTHELLALQPGDELIIRDVWGAITYQGEGVFIAGGAGVTPFIAIFRQLAQQHSIGNNKLIFANKTRADIIYREEFEKLLGDNFINILSEEKAEGYAFGLIDKKFLAKHLDGLIQKFYICGPPPMIKAVQRILNDLGIKENAVVVEV
jgi:ferredoxin-NADP reductase